MPRFITVPAGKPGFFCYAPDDGAGGGGQPPGNAGGSPPANVPPAGGGGGTFTQEQLDKVLADRLNRQRVKMESDFDRKLKDMGVTPEKLESFQKWQVDQVNAEKKRKEEQGRFQELLQENQTKAAKEIEEAKQLASSMRDRFHTTLIHNEVSRLVTKFNGHSPEQVAGLLFANFGVDEQDRVVVADDDGNPILDSKGLPYTPETFVQEWLNKNLHFLKASGGGSGYRAPSGGAGMTFTREQLKDPKFYRENKEAIQAAAKAGRITS